MKKLFFSSALALFAVAAVAQTKTNAKSDVSVTAKSNTNKNKEKGTEVSGNATSKSDVEISRDDVNRDGKFSPEERAARKEAKKEEMRTHKADRADDGILNGSASENNAHGKAVSEIATGTTLEGREKGAAVSGIAKTNSNGELRRGENSPKVEVTPEEKAARKQSRREGAKSRKADRADDGLLNGSSDKHVHGKAVGGAAVGTGVRGRARGVEVSTGARTKARVGTGLGVSIGKKPRKG